MAITYDSGPTIMLQLGAFQFGISTAAFQELARSSEYRWAPQDLYGQLPTRQFTGPGDEFLSLPGVIYPEWRGGFAQVEQMRAMAGEGQPLPMVDGDGASLGRWAIERVEEKKTAFAAAGRARRVEFTLQLVRLPDEEAEGAISVDGVAAAVTSTTSVSIPANATTTLAKSKGLAGSVSSVAGSISGALVRAGGDLQTALAPYTDISRAALGGVNRSLGVVGELQDVANRSLSIIGVQGTDLSALLGAQNLAARANRLLTTAESASAMLRTSGSQLSAIAGASTSARNAMQTAQASVDRAATLVRQTAAQAATIGA